MNTLSTIVRDQPPAKHLYRVFIAMSIVAVFIVAGSVRANAEEEQLPERFGLRLGGYAIQNYDSIMRLDKANFPIGTYIDFQNTLGGETKSTVFRLDGYYRFNERHAITFSWYAARFNGSRVLDTEFIWDGVTYPIGVHVDSRLELDVYKLGYQYSLYHNDKVELGASFGFHISRTSFGISANGSQSDTTAITAPLPVFGLFADYKFTPRFSVYYNYQFFFINYQDMFRGGLQDFLLGLEYRVFRNVALGGAYNRFGSNLKAQWDDKTFYRNTNWNGWMLYAAVYF